MKSTFTLVLVAIASSVPHARGFADIDIPIEGFSGDLDPIEGFPGDLDLGNLADALMPCKCTIAGSNCASTASAMGAPANTVFPFVMPALCAKQCNSWNNIMLSGGCTATFSQKSGSTSCIPPNFDNIPAAKLTCEGSAAACDCVSIMGKHYDCDENGNGSCQDADNGPHDHGGNDHGGDHGGGWGPAPSPLGGSPGSSQNQSPTAVCDDDCKDKAKTAVTGLAIGIIIVIVIASLCGLAICVIIIKCIMAASAPPAPVQQPTYVMKTGVQMQGMQQNPMVAEAVVVQQVPGNPRKFESAQTSSVSQI